MLLEISRISEHLRAIYESVNICAESRNYYLALTKHFARIIALINPLAIYCHPADS